MQDDLDQSHCPSLDSTRCCATTRGRAPSPSAATINVPSRERDVLRLLAEGYRYEQIALHLEISLSSVRTYIARAYKRLNVSTKSEAIANAMRAGILR